MKNIMFVLIILCGNISFAQSFSGVKVYISNPYVHRVDAIKPQMYNMDYVRSHYATHIYSMEENYINSLYDSLQSLDPRPVARDSVGIVVPQLWGGTLDMNFEPCIVIDFIIGSKYNTNEEVWTFAMDRNGKICRTFQAIGNQLCHPDRRCTEFLKRQFPGMFFLVQ